MPRIIRFEVPGAPAGKGRPRFVRATGHVYTPARTGKYEGLVRLAAAQAMAGAAPGAGALLHLDQRLGPGFAIVVAQEADGRPCRTTPPHHQTGRR